MPSDDAQDSAQENMHDDAQPRLEEMPPEEAPRREASTSPERALNRAFVPIDHQFAINTAYRSFTDHTFPQTRLQSTLLLQQTALVEDQIKFHMDSLTQLQHHLQQLVSLQMNMPSAPSSPTAARPSTQGSTIQEARDTSPSSSSQQSSQDDE